MVCSFVIPFTTPWMSSPRSSTETSSPTHYPSTLPTMPPVSSTEGGKMGKMSKIMEVLYFLCLVEHSGIYFWVSLICEISLHYFCIDHFCLLNGPFRLLIWSISSLKVVCFTCRNGIACKSIDNQPITKK